MPSKSLDPAAVRVIVRVAFAPKSPTKSDFSGDELKARNQLAKDELIKYEGRSPSFVHLTDRGWAWLNDHPDAGLTSVKGGTRRAYELTSFILQALGRQLRARNLTLGELMASEPDHRGADDDSLAPPGGPADPPPRPPHTDDPTLQQIRTAYLELAGGRWNTRVLVADLRAALSAVPRAKLDDALVDMQTRGAVVLMHLRYHARSSEKTVVDPRSHSVEKNVSVE